MLKAQVTVQLNLLRMLNYRKTKLNFIIFKRKEVGNDVYPQSWKSTLGVFYMTKISVKTKLKAVEEYANRNVTLASVRHKYGIAEYDLSQIRGKKGIV